MVLFNTVYLYNSHHTHTLYPVPDPMFEMTMYTVPENNRTVPLCIDIGVMITESETFTITAVQKDPPEAEGGCKRMFYHIAIP